jgi:NAD(P)H dehydrogenase (quinone)
MKHAIITGHPNPESFTFAVAGVYAEAVKALGHAVVERDLYRCAFDPRLRNEEIPRPSGFAAGDDVEAERALIADADTFVFVYPLWFNFPPAILTGYVQRVFGTGFGYNSLPPGGRKKLLLGRGMISFSSSGSPSEWLRSQGSWEAIRHLFDDHVAEVCGLTMLEHRHFGRIQPNTPASQIEAHLKEVKTVVERLFGPR